MKKVVSLFTTALIVIVLFAVTGCSPKEPLVIKESDTYIVISVSDAQIKITEDTTLLNYMDKLKEKGELTFEINGGMISSINGIANPSDWSSCWMLYTSDTENASTGWGTIVYKENTYGSATLGAESLKIKDGCLYIWVFQSFS